MSNDNNSSAPRYVIPSKRGSRELPSASSGTRPCSSFYLFGESAGCAKNKTIHSTSSHSHEMCDKGAWCTDDKCVSGRPRERLWTSARFARFRSVVDQSADSVCLQLVRNNPPRRCWVEELEQVMFGLHDTRSLMQLLNPKNGLIGGLNGALPYDLIRPGCSGYDQKKLNHWMCLAKSMLTQAFVHWEDFRKRERLWWL